jgi:hypothetical protein
MAGIGRCVYVLPALSTSFDICETVILGPFAFVPGKLRRRTLRLAASREILRSAQDHTAFLVKSQQGRRCL